MVSIQTAILSLAFILGVLAMASPFPFSLLAWTGVAIILLIANF